MKYLVWFSGGTDSVFVSWYLKKQGHDVLLVNLKNTKEKNKCCSLPTELLKVSTFLELPLKIVDATKDFKKLVIEDFIETYLKSKTPNPCINCNKNVRFKILNQIREELNYDFITTGHYVEKIELLWKDNKLYYSFAIPKDLKKDQTYMLYQLISDQDIVKYLDFPISNFEKSEIKQMLNKENIPINTEQESQNICFIPDDDYPRYIKQAKNIQIPKWKIMDTKWNYLWEHKWLIYYTIWQRKGLNINSHLKMYVVDMDYKNNILIVWENKDLLKNEVKVSDLILLWNIGFDNLKDFFDLENIYWKIRYKWNLEEVEKIEDNKVFFKNSLRAITPGQHLVLYWKKKWKMFVVGWGIIES